MRGRLPRRLARAAPGLRALLAYDRRDLGPDVVAGLSVAAVALPVGIAYAEIAGVPAIIGLYSAILPLVAYALFGSSRLLITGPDAATCIMAAASVGALAGGDAERYAALMMTLTIVTGLLYLVAGAARLGFIANFLSQPILVGYLNGVALLILVGQAPKLFGFQTHADGFGPQVVAFLGTLGATHVTSLLLGAGLVALLMTLKWLAPRLPAALLAIGAGIALVWLLDLGGRGVQVLGDIPSALPTLRLPDWQVLGTPGLLGDAAGIVLISFTSGVLTAKSFARRTKERLDANQELVGFGACNLASGLAGGFPVTGADSRTAVNYATGGRTQLVGLVAALAMLVSLAALTGPLALVPQPALAAVIVVAALGLADLGAVQALWRASRREFWLCIVTTLGVLVLGVLPGVLVAIVLSLLWLLAIASRPPDAVLGRAPGVPGFHDLADYPNAVTTPGVLLYRFNASLLFFNVDYFRERVLRAVALTRPPVRWVVIDASPINLIDYTALQGLIELRDELAARDIKLVLARVKRALGRQFAAAWIERVSTEFVIFETPNTALRAFQRAAAADGRPGTG